MNIEEGPFLSVLEKTDGVFRKEIINYRKRDGQLVIEKSIRTFFSDGDYDDTTEVIPLCKTGE